MTLGLLHTVWVSYKAALLLANREPVFDANDKIQLTNQLDLPYRYRNRIPSKSGQVRVPIHIYPRKARPSISSAVLNPSHPSDLSPVHRVSTFPHTRL